MATVNKSAKTGQFVSDKAVKSSPTTTYKQTISKPAPRSSGSKGTGKK